MPSLRTFYAIAVTQTLSLAGSRMTAIGVGIWLFTNTGATTPLLLMAFFNELPGMLGGSLAGVWVDRWERRRVLILADLGQAAGSVLLLASFLSGHFQTWHLYLIVLVQGVFAVFQGPAEDATITMLVPEAHRERANAIREMAFPLAGVVAPALAGLVYALVGIMGVILVDLATFLAAVAALYLVHIPQPKQTEEGRAAVGNAWQEMLGGFRFFGQRRPLLILLLYFVFTGFLLNGPLELAVPYLISLTGSEAVMGGLMAVMSLGAFAGAALIAAWGGTRPRIHTLMPGMMLCGVMFLVYGVVRTPLALGLAIFILMIPLPISNALLISILQVKTPPDMQGRIFALVSQLGFVGSTASFILVGPLVDRVLEPAVGRPGWQVVSWLVGSQAGSGIGLLQIITGVLMLAGTAVVYGLAAVRHLEATLPSYEAIAEEGG